MISLDILDYGTLIINDKSSEAHHDHLAYFHIQIFTFMCKDASRNQNGKENGNDTDRDERSSSVF
jgi:hypothetical protein